LHTHVIMYVSVKPNFKLKYGLLIEYST